MVLLLLLVALALKREWPVTAAIIVLVVNALVPMVLKPLAVVWLGVSHAIGAVMSTVLLTIVYVVVVTPMGLLRRAAGKDTLRLTAFRRGEVSVMTERHHRFASADLERPY
jgi:L-lactate permease